MVRGEVPGITYRQKPDNYPGHRDDDIIIIIIIRLYYQLQSDALCQIVSTMDRCAVGDATKRGSVRGL